jgi:DUF1680 family protein
MAGVEIAANGLWGRWQRRNSTITIPYGISSLEASGNLDNFRRLVGLSDAEFRGFSFNDTDVYKTLEAIAWSSITGSDPRLDDFMTSTATLMSKVQAADGTLNSYVQGSPGAEQYDQLADSHELYTAGHLFQAAVADFRATGLTRLLDIAILVADHLVEEFGDQRRPDYDGHPEIETALVELFRLSGRSAYLQLAKQFVDNRGQRIFRNDRRGDSYFQDRDRVRKERSIVGHAVRALYLEAGVVDVAVETSDAELLASSVTRWLDMVESKLYLTGGVGSRHKSEGFGDPYELSPDRAYCETCAAVASIHWNWRLLLATGESRYADLLERTLYNGFAASTGLDGISFFYSNPLQIRTVHEASDQEESAQRLSWYACACCPPNIMRMFASLAAYLATTNDRGVQFHQFTDADVSLLTGDGPLRLAMRTEYPWHGHIAVTVVESPPTAWALSLRLPAWTTQDQIAINGVTSPAQVKNGYVLVERAWTAGDQVVLNLDIEPRVTSGNRKIDAVRGCVAIERGPLVYCIEAVDNASFDLAGISIKTAGPLQETPIDDLPAVPAVVAQGVLRVPVEPEDLLYQDVDSREVIETSVDVVAVPYFLWANRGGGPMRVWIPRAECHF